jgi:hypothetical protein
LFLIACLTILTSRRAWKTFDTNFWYLISIIDITEQFALSYLAKHTALITAGHISRCSICAEPICDFPSVTVAFPPP